MTAFSEVLLEARNVTKSYQSKAALHAHDKALDSVSVKISAGETLGIVGESGSGKTTLIRLLLGVELPTSGSILFRGISIGQLDSVGRRSYRKSVAAIFQNPYSSLDPRMRIWELITEQLFIEHTGTRDQRRLKARELLKSVGLDSQVAERYAHQLSGGQRQRVAIARALVSNPKVVILDEAVSALDVSVRAQIVNLLLDLQESLNLTYVFIAHDLAIVQHFCHRTIVMYRGKVVEEGKTKDIFAKPAHPYTAALIEASYVGEVQLESWAKPLSTSRDEPPPDGCAYQPRCPLATSHCISTSPPNVALGGVHQVLCHYPMGFDRAHGSPVLNIVES